MTICFQYGDPVIDVLHYIVEVRQPGHDFPRLLHLASSKEMRRDATAEETIAIVHEDDLQLIQEVVSPNQMLEYLSEADQ